MADTERTREVGPRHSRDETGEQSGRAFCGASCGEPYAAEPVERRAGTKGNAGQQSTCRTQSRESVSQALERIRRVARERKKERFTTLFQHINVDPLEEAFYALKENAAPAVDRLRWRDYEASSANSRTCTDGSSGERIGRCRAVGCTYPSRMADNARSRSPLWRTRSSNGQWSRC